MSERPFVEHSPFSHLEMASFIDVNKPVEVYKNLHKNCWSVRQDGKVRFHCAYVCLRDVVFVVRQRGREKVLETKRKNVHAFVKGYICPVSEANVSPACWDGVYYNPYVAGYFVNRTTEQPVDKAQFVDMMVEDPEPVLALVS